MTMETEGKKKIELRLDLDVVRELRRIGLEKDLDDPWTPSRVAADIVTMEIAGRNWVDSRFTKT